MMWKDGSKFEGEWQHGLAHGAGMLTYPDGFVLKGVWKRNLLIDKHYIDKILSVKSSLNSLKI